MGGEFLMVCLLAGLGTRHSAVHASAVVTYFPSVVTDLIMEAGEKRKLQN